MKITLVKKINNTTQFLVVPLFEDEKLSTTGPAEIKKILQTREKSKDFKAKSGDCLYLTPDSADLPQKVLLYGLGKKNKLSSKKIRNDFAKIAKKSKSKEHTAITLHLPKELYGYAQEISEGIILANYQLGIYQTGKSKTNNEKQSIKNLTVLANATPARTNEINKNLEKGMIIASAVNETRNLVNGPNNYVNAETLSKAAVKIAKENGYKCTILDRKQLEKKGLGALIGVNLGSDKGAKLAILEYKPKGAKGAPLLFVGKGVTFDSGGYNLKPTSAITNMKEDMAGAAVVLGVFRLLKKLNIKQNVIGVTPLTDNLIGSKAQKVNDIVTSYSGKTIEITNTDAEGRLVLADAISYAIDRFKPAQVIDLATLTGACMVALGDRYAGLFGNDKKIISALRKAGNQTDELLWQLPIHPDYRKKMKSKIADLQNSEGSGLAGASKGAAFIQEFVGKTKWAHLDIAGVTFVKDPKPYDHEAATGFGVRLLMEYLEKLE